MIDHSASIRATWRAVGHVTWRAACDAAGYATCLATREATTSLLASWRSR